MKKHDDDDEHPDGRGPVERDLERLKRLVDAGIECILRRADVRLVVGLSDTKIDVAEAAGLFPKRVRISSRAAGWKASEIFAYVASRPLATDVPPDLAGDPARKRQHRRALRRPRGPATTPRPTSRRVISTGERCE